MTSPSSGAPMTLSNLVKLRKGTIGQTWRATHARRGLLVAVKKIPISFFRDATSMTTPDSTVQGVMDLRYHRHPHLLEIDRVFVSDDNGIELCIITPFCQNSLQHLIDEARFIDGTDFINTFLGETLSALAFLASHHLPHGNLKPANILYSRPNLEYQWQLADFGLVRHLKPQGNRIGVYQAPEMNDVGRPSCEADVWALLACFVMAMGNVCNLEGRERLVMPREEIARTWLLVQVGEFVREERWAMMRPMGEGEPEKRATAERMLSVLDPVKIGGAIRIGAGLWRNTYVNY